MKKFIVALSLLLTLTPSMCQAKDISNTPKIMELKKEVYEDLSPYMQIKSKLYDIKVVDNYITDIEEYKDVKKSSNDIVNGLTNIKAGEIYIYEQSSDSKTKHILYHELGHILDSYDEFDNMIFRKGKKYSKTDEFKLIFDAEYKKINSISSEKYVSADISEYFAESFALYKDSPELLKQTAPLTFNYIEEKSSLPYIEQATDNQYLIQFKHDFFKDNGYLNLDTQLTELYRDIF